MSGRTGFEYHPSPQMLKLLERAVDLRASGMPWAEVARQLNRHISTCQEWPISYRSVWDRLYMVAIRRRFNAILAEAGIHLCRLMRTDDLKITLGACREVIRHFPKDLPNADGILRGFDEADGILDGLNDEQINELAELVRPTLVSSTSESGSESADSLGEEEPD